MAQLGQRILTVHKVIKGRRKGVSQGVVGLLVGQGRGFADCPIGRFGKLTPVSVGQLYQPPRLIANLTKIQVRVIKRIVDFAGSIQRPVQPRQEPLLLTG